MATPNSPYYVFPEVGFYDRMAGAGGGVSDMSVDNAFGMGFGTGIMAPPEGSVSMMSEGGGSSVASNNNSRAAMLMHPDLGVAGGDASVAGPPNKNAHQRKEEERVGGVVEVEGQDDALVSALMDERYPGEGLAGYEGWTIDLSKLTMEVPSFAKGTFGRLYRGTYRRENVAVKILERPVDSKNLSRALLMEQQFAQEVSMLAALQHPNVVRFLGACRKPLVWCIVMEYAEGGSVRSFLNHRSRHNRTVPLKLALQQALDIARGMQHLHSLGFIHRDLKSDNLLIAADKSIKIADFGGARIEVQADNMTPGTGTYRWMAPEMIQHRPYNHKVDVYSFGIVLWELMTGELPFQKMTSVQAAFSVVNRGLRPAIPPDCPPALANIMVQCWDANPEQRPSFSLITEMLEDARKEILTTVRRARFRYMCLATPLTLE